MNNLTLVIPIPVTFSINDITNNIEEEIEQIIFHNYSFLNKDAKLFDETCKRIFIEVGRTLLLRHDLEKKYLK